MNVDPVASDVAAPTTLTHAAPDASKAFARTLDALGSTLGDANAAEDAFAQGHGSLLHSVYARAQADVALTVATAAAQRAAQALQTVLSMHI